MSDLARNVPQERAASAAPAAQPQVGGGGAGLVPSKTSLDGLFVNLAPSAVAERRVKRLKRAVWASGHLHALADHGRRPPQCWFVTLTYRPGVEWSPKHISHAIGRYRDWCRRSRLPVRYTWVAELQQRGAVHYHLLVWLPHNVAMPQWDRVFRGSRVEFWQHGMTNTERARAGVGYLMKYLSKLGELSRFPKGLRLYGIGGLTEQGRNVRSWFNLPEWVKASYGVGEIARRSGRLVVRCTGEILEPAFNVVLTPAGLLVRALRPLAQRFHDGAYSTWSPQ